MLYLSLSDYKIQATSIRQQIVKLSFISLLLSIQDAPKLLARHNPPCSRLCVGLWF